MTPAAALSHYQQRLQLALEGFLPSVTTPPHRLHTAMRYSVLSGGKRIRPLLVYAAGEALGIQPEQLDVIASAVECIHAYSLIHDDLPAMDDDDLRRGLPTCHKAFDEATAILAGDALQTLAFELLASARLAPALIPQRLAMIQVLAKASGSLGMAGGQALDLAATGQALALTELETIHRLKTGALIQAGIEMTTLAASDLAPADAARLIQFAQNLGLAFQIQDDILDIESPTAVLGKQQGADASRRKATYPQLLGLEGAKQKAQALLTANLDILDKFIEQGQLLRYLTMELSKRKA